MTRLPLPRLMRIPRNWPDRGNLSARHLMIADWHAATAPQGVSGFRPVFRGSAPLEREACARNRITRNAEIAQAIDAIRLLANDPTPLIAHPVLQEVA